MECASDKPELKEQTAIELARQFVRQQHKEAWEDAKKSPDASPWRLVQLGGIKHIGRAFEITRDLLIREITDSLTHAAMPDQERREIEQRVADQVDARIGEFLTDVRYDYDYDNTPQTSS